ncbi:serine/threonine-protein kinase [Spirillospora sp. CA-255316]
MASAQMVIDGRFELLERLGSGGMGTVWRAQDLALHREVALKEVRVADAPPDEDPVRAAKMRERVLREARALARLDHPSVVTVHHIVDSSETAHPWIVMELVRGRSLEDRLQDGTMPPAEAAETGRGILAALRAAHAAGICHRDVKPANVLLREDGSPVLTDFGIAALRESTRVTATGGLVGSPLYIAPERLRGEEGNPASDFWSLGMLLYVAVEGHHPMRRDSPVATLAAVMGGTVPPPRQAGPLTPVLHALLVPDPAARPAPEQLDRMLAQAASGRAPIPAVPNPAAPMPPPGPAGPMPPPRPAGPMPPPRPAGPMPPFHRVPPGRTTHPTGMGAPPRPPAARQGRRRAAPLAAVLVLAAAVFAAVLATGVVVLPKLLELGGQEAGDRLRTETEPTTTGGATERSGAGTQAAGTGSLLTPARIRGVVTALEKASGGVEFTRFTVYPEHASAEAPIPGRGNLYDRFSYRDGQATRTSAGGTLGSDDAKVKLRAFDWDQVPKLLKTAESKLGVVKPTNRYLIVDPAWAFANDRPVLLVYVSDEYGGAYLAADMKGKVLRSFPRRG